MLGWYGERGKRGQRKEGGFELTWKLWKIFAATQFLETDLSLHTVFNFIHNCSATFKKLTGDQGDN
jgi:hypothetical protein